MILYSFYKNIVLYMTQFWYSFSNSFSGNLSMEGWTLSFFNILFTLAPPLILGVFDQHISARLLDQYPQLYGQTFFSKRLFLGWTINAFYHSFLCYLFVTVAFWGSVALPGGYNSYQWIWGTTLFVTVLVTVLGKVRENGRFGVAQVSFLLTIFCFACHAGGTRSQAVDKVHFRRNPWLFRLHDYLPDPLCHHCSVRSSDTPLSRIVS